jgi:hypothetical protein
VYVFFLRDTDLPSGGERERWLCVECSWCLRGLLERDRECRLGESVGAAECERCLLLETGGGGW